MVKKKKILGLLCDLPANKCTRGRNEYCSGEDYFSVHSTEKKSACYSTKLKSLNDKKFPQPS